VDVLLRIPLTGFRQLLVGFRRKSFRDGAGIDTVR
jgi:hypothetical protein